MVGLLRAFVNFVLAVVVFAVILAIGSRVRGFDFGVSILKFSLLLVASVAVLWFMWKRRKNPSTTTYHLQYAWLPKKWQKWMIGQVDDDKA